MIDDIHSAYERAQAAQRAGIATVDIACDALNREYRPIVTPFPGCRGFVRQRLNDRDGIPVQLIVRCDVSDVLAYMLTEYRKTLETPEQPNFKRRYKPRGIMRR